jgi:hypothetical protein
MQMALIETSDFFDSFLNVKGETFTMVVKDFKTIVSAQGRQITFIIGDIEGHECKAIAVCKDKSKKNQVVVNGQKLEVIKREGYNQYIAVFDNNKLNLTAIQTMVLESAALNKLIAERASEQLRELLKKDSEKIDANLYLRQDQPPEPNYRAIRNEGTEKKPKKDNQPFPLLGYIFLPVILIVFIALVVASILGELFFVSLMTR